MQRCAVLDAAGEAVGEGPAGRGLAYGPADAGLGLIAALWSADLGIAVGATDVARLMALLKLARAKSRPGHADSWIDAAGYAALGAELAGARREAPAADGEEGLEFGAELAEPATLAAFLEASDRNGAALPVMRIADPAGGYRHRGRPVPAAAEAPALSAAEAQQVESLRRRHWGAAEIARWLELDQALVEAAIAAAPEPDTDAGRADPGDDAGDPVAPAGDPVAAGAGPDPEPLPDPPCEPVPEAAPEVARPEPGPQRLPEPDAVAAVMVTRLKAVRTKRGVRANALADRVGISKSFYSEIERGKKQPGRDVAFAIARELDASAEELFGEVAKVVGRSQAAVAKRFRQLVPEPGLIRQRKALDLARKGVADLDAVAAAAAALTPFGPVPVGQEAVDCGPGQSDSTVEA
ncbi:MAG: Helix-turn-helix domain protein [Planctomycetes bacterium ADurb.Bin069]|nr:MAG: Helix-turn-helix domain protein [Planctomycetes bacterium ADurb.Bin069]